MLAQTLLKTIGSMTPCSLTFSGIKNYIQVCFYHSHRGLYTIPKKYEISGIGCVQASTADSIIDCIK